MRTIIYWGLYWGPLFSGKLPYILNHTKDPFKHFILGFRVIP